MPERLHDLLERLVPADCFARRPGNFAASPEHPMDAFSEILSGVKLNGAVFFTAEFSAPWGLTTPSSEKMETLPPGAAHVVLYHLLIEGAAVVEMLDGQTVDLCGGDIVIFPHGHAHHMSSGP